MSRIQTSLAEFRATHRNKLNVAFHILCGLVYISILLHLTGLGGTAAVIYGGFAWALLPAGHTLALLGMTATLLVGQHLVLSLRLSWRTLLMVAAAAYFAPELSHLVTGEPTVLKADALTLPGILENIVMLLPYSILSLSS